MKICNFSSSEAVRDRQRIMIPGRKETRLNVDTGGGGGGVVDIFAKAFGVTGHERSA